MVEVSLTVGKLDASLALLLTKDHHLIEFPTILLPNGVKAGSIVKLLCEEDVESEKAEAKLFQKIQDEILESFGKNLPEPPVLKIKNVTQTLCVLEWEPLELGTASLKNLVLFKDKKKLGVIPQPLTSLTTKLSGLPINETFQFQLKLDTTAGIYSSDVINVTTHTMTDLSGITVCLGDFSKNEQFSTEDIIDTLKSMGAHYPPQDRVKVDTTHFICTRENKQNPEFLNASEMNIPIVRPEWLKACETERRVVGVRDFYVKDCALPDILAKNYWGKSNSKRENELPELPKEEIPKEEIPKEEIPKEEIQKEEIQKEENPKEENSKEENPKEEIQKEEEEKPEIDEKVSVIPEKQQKESESILETKESEEAVQNNIPVVVIDSPPAEAARKVAVAEVEDPIIETEPETPAVSKDEIKTNGDLAGSVETLIIPEKIFGENAEEKADEKAKTVEVKEEKATVYGSVSEQTEPVEHSETVEGDLAAEEVEIEPELAEVKVEEGEKEEGEDKKKEEEEEEGEEDGGEDGEEDKGEGKKETNDDKKVTPVASKANKKKKKKNGKK